VPNPKRGVPTSDNRGPTSEGFESACPRPLNNRGTTSLGHADEPEERTEAVDELAGPVHEGNVGPRRDSPSPIAIPVAIFNVEYPSTVFEVKHQRGNIVNGGTHVEPPESSPASDSFQPFYERAANACSLELGRYREVCHHDRRILVRVNSDSELRSAHNFSLCFSDQILGREGSPNLSFGLPRRIRPGVHVLPDRNVFYLSEGLPIGGRGSADSNPLVALRRILAVANDPQ
jgi:hypothetical protein